MKLYDFKCPKGHIEEHFAKDDEKQRRCSCGELSRRIISPVRAKLDPLSGHFPTASDKWAKMHERGAKPAD